MVAYSAIADATIAVNKPITNSLVTLLRDNPIALFELMGWSVSAGLYSSPEQTITSGAATTLNHGLTSLTPVEAELTTYIVCQTAEFNYSIGDVVIIPAGGNFNNGSYGIGLTITSTQVVATVASSGIYIVNKTTGANAIITNGSWKFVVNVRG